MWTTTTLGLNSLLESQVTETNLAVEKKVEMMSDNLKHPTEYPVVLPVLPLRNIVVFPGMIVPLFVGREKSIRALEDVMANDKICCWLARRDQVMGRICIKSAQ